MSFWVSLFWYQLYCIISISEVEAQVEAPTEPKPKSKPKPKAQSKRKRQPTPESSDADDSDFDEVSEWEYEVVTPRSLRERPAVQPAYADSDADSDSDIEYELGGNEAGIEEEQFSSDDDVGEVAEQIHLHARLQRRRVKKRFFIKFRELAAPFLSETAAESDSSDSEDDVNEPAFQHRQETSKDRERTERLNAKADNQAARRRKGEVVNECVEDEYEDSDYELELSVAEFLRKASDTVREPAL